jgi:hypothetical protein
MLNILVSALRVENFDAFRLKDRKEIGFLKEHFWGTLKYVEFIISF